MFNTFGQAGGLGGFGAQAAAPAAGAFGGFSAPAAPAAGGFGAPAGGFGAPSQNLFGGGAAPASGGLFGAPATAAPTGGLFGASAGGLGGNTFGQPAAAGGNLFGQPAAAAQPFGAAPAAGGGLFGAAQTGNLFGQPQQQPQQQQQTAGGFGGGLFGQSAPAAQTNLFGQPGAAAPNQFGASAGAFGAPGGGFGAGAFGAPSATPRTGTRHTAYRVIDAPEKDPKNPHIDVISKMQSISAMPEFASYSFEELRCQDLNIQTPIASSAPVSPAAGAPNAGFGGQNLFGAAQPAAGGMFGAPAAQPATGGLFGAQAGQSAGGSLFGQNSSAPQPGGLFGNAQPATGGSLFGNQTQQMTGGMFGAQTQQPAQSGLFGNQAQPAAGGMFGNQAQPATGSLFGQQNSAPGGLFGGQAQPAAGAFGASAPQPAAGSGLFGSTPPATGGLFGGSTPAAQPATGGLFGSQAGQPAGGNLFGQTATAPQTGGLFSNTFGAQTQQPATGGGLFGNQAQQPAAGGGMFGSQTQPVSGGLFGNQSQPATGGSLFGSQPQAATGGMFGTQTQPASGSFFGNQTQPNAGGSLFGNNLSFPSAPGVAAPPQPAAVTATPVGTGHITTALQLQQLRTQFADYPFANAVSAPTPKAEPLVEYSMPTTKPAQTPRVLSLAAPSAPTPYHAQSRWLAAGLAPGGNQIVAATPRAASMRSAPISFDGAIVPVTPAHNRLAEPKTPYANLSEAQAEYDLSLGDRPQPTNTVRKLKLRSVDDLRKTPARPSASLSEPNASDSTALTISSESSAATCSNTELIITPSLSTVCQFNAVRGLRVEHPQFGRVEWEGDVDISGMEFNDVVEFSKQSVEVYGKCTESKPKPAEGTKLNRPAHITLFHCFPKNSDQKSVDKFEKRLRAICAERDQVKFINYDHISGEWSFRVAHFTKYGLEDDEDEDSDNDSDMVPVAHIGRFCALDADNMTDDSPSSVRSAVEMPEVSPSPLRPPRRNLSFHAHEAEEDADESVDEDYEQGDDEMEFGDQIVESDAELEGGVVRDTDAMINSVAPADELPRAIGLQPADLQHAGFSRLAATHSLHASVFASPLRAAAVLDRPGVDAASAPTLILPTAPSAGAEHYTTLKLKVAAQKRLSEARAQAKRSGKWSSLSSKVSDASKHCEGRLDSSLLLSNSFRTSCTSNNRFAFLTTSKQASATEQTNSAMKPGRPLIVSAPVPTVETVHDAKRTVVTLRAESSSHHSVSTQMLESLLTALQRSRDASLYDRAQSYLDALSTVPEANTRSLTEALRLIHALSANNDQRLNALLHVLDSSHSSNPTAERDPLINALLSGRIADAAALADDPKLATLIALADSPAARHDMQAQMQAWRSTGAWQRIDARRQRIFALLADQGDSAAGLSTSWHAALALSLRSRHVTDESSLVSAVASFLQSRGVSCPSDNKPVCFAALVLFALHSISGVVPAAAQNSQTLCTALLRPHQSDFTLPFVLSTLLPSLLEISAEQLQWFARARARVATSFASQLASSDAWPCAVHVLHSAGLSSEAHRMLHQFWPSSAFWPVNQSFAGLQSELSAENDGHTVLVPLATEQRVYDLSSAYSMLDVSSAPLRYLLDIACIPPAWLLEAQATRCAYERKPQFQLAALYCAMQMADRAEAPRLRTEAATLLVTQLAPLLIVQGRVEQLRAWLLDLSAGGPLEPLMQSPHVAYLLMLDVVSDSAVDSMEGSSSADQIAQAAQRVLTLIEQSKGSASSLVDRACMSAMSTAASQTLASLTKIQSVVTQSDLSHGDRVRSLYESTARWLSTASY